MLIPKYIPAIILFFALDGYVFAQTTDSTAWTKDDTVVLKPDEIEPIQINCPVLNGFGSGEEELLVVNSNTDVQYAFGYNCSMPNIDFSVKTLLYVSIAPCSHIRTKVSLIKNEVILSIYTCKRGRGYHGRIVSILIPKIGRDSSVHLDINEEENMQENENYSK
jgi:hypothetical protein